VESFKKLFKKKNKSQIVGFNRLELLDREFIPWLEDYYPPSSQSSPNHHQNATIYTMLGVLGKTS
jgi:hypothetical protein